MEWLSDVNWIGVVLFAGTVYLVLDKIRSGKLLASIKSEVSAPALSNATRDNVLYRLRNIQRLFK